jgi:hypothetical protein
MEKDAPKHVAVGRFEDQESIAISNEERKANPHPARLPGTAPASTGAHEERLGPALTVDLASL